MPDRPGLPSSDVGWATELGLGDDVGLVARLVRLNLFVSRLLDELSALADLTAPDYLVLAVVARSPDQRTSPSRMGELLGRSSGGLSLTIDRLTAAGLLTRAKDPADGRRAVVGVTEEGDRRWRLVNSALHEVEGRLPLDRSERAEYEQAIQRLIELFEDPMDR